MSRDSAGGPIGNAKVVMVISADRWMAGVAISKKIAAGKAAPVVATLTVIAAGEPAPAVVVLTVTGGSKPVPVAAVFGPRPTPFPVLQSLFELRQGL